MDSVYIWGAGDYAENAFAAIDLNKCYFKGLVDRNAEKQHTLWKNKYSIVSPEKALQEGADYYLISVLSANPIIKQAVEMGVKKQQLIRFWEDELSDYSFVSELFLLKNENEYLKKRLANAPYEYGFLPSPKLMSNDEMFQLLRENRKSLSRYGDGEFEMIRQKERPWFQHVNSRLADRLGDILKTEQDKVIIGIADNFGNLDKYTDKAADSIRDYVAGDTRVDIMNMLLPDYIYADAYITRPYYIYRDKKYIVNVIEQFKKIWNGRNILLLESAFSRIGAGNDLFDNVKSVRRIICPQKDAFEKYDEIITAVKGHYQSGDLVLVSLGPTATVLAYDLGMEEMQTIDIGQIDTEYEWYLRGATDREEIPGKSVSELSWWHEPEMVEGSDEYHQQIMAEIKG